MDDFKRQETVYCAVIVEKGYLECVKYFNENGHLKSKYSEAGRGPLPIAQKSNKKGEIK